jgi:type IV pilus assembly protein PilC
MPTFRIKMATAGGRVVEKTLFADTKSSLLDHLERDGNFVLHIKRSEGMGALLKGGWGLGRVRAKDLITFNQEFAVLVKAGLPIVSALEAIIDKGGETALNAVLKEIRNDISGGESLSGSFGKYSHIFSTLYVASLQAGERSGNIPQAISRHIVYMKKMAEIKRKVITASVYPLILTVVSIVTLLFLLIYVVPSFTQTYFDSGTELPGMTLMLVQVSHLLKSNFIYLLLVLAGGVVALGYMRRGEAGKVQLDRWKIKTPFLGEVYLHYSLSKMARTLSTILKGGTPLLESTRISAGSMDNALLKRRLDEVCRSLEEGGGFSTSLGDIAEFPRLAVRMIHAGESSGSLEEVLDDMAEYYESDVDTKLSILTSAIEPALMIVMGLLIGFIVLAMYMPIFQMAGTVS